MWEIPDYHSNKLHFWGARFLICGIVLLIYIFILRPLRFATTQRVVYPQVQYFEDKEINYSSALESGYLIVDYDYKQKSKQLHYRPEFGFFFLVSFLTLLFITQRKKHYYLLVGLHLSATILSYLFLMTGVMGLSIGFIATDIIHGYLTPAFTLALPPLIETGLIDKG